MEGSGQAGEVALPDPSQLLPREASPVQIAMASTPDPLHTDAKEAVSAVQTVDECLTSELCIDQYLWSLYQRTPKVDTIKVVEQKKASSRKERQIADHHPKNCKARPRGFHMEGPGSGRKSRYATNGIRYRRDGPELQAATVSCASRHGRRRARARHNERIPR